MKNIVRKMRLLAFFLLVQTGSAHAYEVVVAKVTLVEPSYMPTAITFKIDKALPSCPAGAFLKWEHNADNNKAVLASLLTAMVTGRKIVLHIADGDTLCRGLLLHVLDA